MALYVRVASRDPGDFAFLIREYTLEVHVEIRGVRKYFSDEINETAWELQDAGARITGIRDADMKDMSDYIHAYSQMEPLLNDYD